MKLKIDLTKAIKEDLENGGYLIPIKTPFKQGDCYGDLISVDVETQCLWFDYRIAYVLEAGQKSEEYQEISDWLNEVFEGAQIGTSILGYIRRNIINGYIE